MNPETQQLKDKLSKLKSFLDKGNFTEKEIISWASDCVAFFSVIGVSESVISSFLKTFENHLPKERKVEIDNKLDLDTNFAAYKFGKYERFFLGPFYKDSIFGNYTNLFKGGSFIYLDVALRTAEEIINSKEDTERLIAKSLVEVFDRVNTQTIKVSLESIESNYQSRDARGMISPLITTITEILNFMPEIQKLKSSNVGSRLKYLYEKKEVYEKYSLNPEVVWALNMSRIIRNEEVDHQKKQHLGNIPMYEAMGCAHLLILFINSVLASGQINLE
jgi:hypothetical protein